MKFFPSKKTERVYFSLHQLVRKEKQKKYMKRSWCIPTRMSFVFTWQTIMALEFSSLFDLLHKQKLFRHNILQLHLLYLWPPNSDAFVAQFLNETLIDETSEI